jgi:hypothetical protein
MHSGSEGKEWRRVTVGEVGERAGERQTNRESERDG